ncbi:MAG: cell division protein FtsA, partial [Brachymonas sp.]|nr:cell division protein FtsA [Brachymonas sp.]
LSGRPPRLLSKQVLAGVIEPRIEEIFALVQKEVQNSGFEHLASSGVVLTGGSARMQGMVELGEDIFLKPVRVAASNYNGALADMVSQPGASVVMGMLEDARQAQQRGYSNTRKGAGGSSLFERLKAFVVGNF